MYKKIRRTENAIAGLIAMLEILTMNTNVLVNLRRLDNWASRTMLPKIAAMVTKLEEMVEETKCLEILYRNTCEVECLGHWEFEDGSIDDHNCEICDGTVANAEMNHKMIKRHIKEIRNFMKAYSEFTEVPMKELTVRQLV
tara:strand:- start:33 stop:455 length:423 start_codon:yes stop_codon:yes gene_type:complete